MSPITTHVLDTSQGHPAAGVTVTLAKLSDAGEWHDLAAGITNKDGRITDLLPADSALEQAIYRLTFATGAYFDTYDMQGFYPFVPIIFEIRHPEQHYHVPLLLNPYGYSTYRGS